MGAFDSKSRMHNTSEPVTPSLAVAKAGEAKLIDDFEDTTPSTPPVGSRAPSEPPPFNMTEEQLQKIINDRVSQAVEERLADLEDGLHSPDVTDNDLQFDDFETKLQVFGLDASKGADIIPGFKTYWFNDEGDRVNQARAMGYVFVKRNEVALNYPKTPDDDLNKDMGENIAVYVGRKADNTPMRAFLMKIPKELAEKRYLRSQRRNDQVEEAIRHGQLGNALQHGGYAGTDGPPGSRIDINYNPQKGQTLARKRPVGG